FDRASPAKGIRGIRHCRQSHRILSVVGLVSKRGYCLTMIEIPHPPNQHDGNQSKDRAAAPAEAFTPSSNLLGNQSEKCGRDQTHDQNGQKEWLNDEDDVPGIPAPAKRLEGTHAIIIGEVEQ